MQNEYETRRIQLELQKKNLIKEYESKPENREELNKELNNIDLQIEENEELKKDEEKNINISLSKKIIGKEGEFIYESWMDDILELHVLENCFDFGRAISFIHEDLKNRNVKNYSLFKENDLRNKWTEFELKKFRKDSDNNTYHYRKEDFFPEEETKKVIENKNEKTEIEKKEENNLNKNENKEGGFKVTILEGNIGEDIIDTSSKIIKQSDEGGLEELD